MNPTQAGIDFQRIDGLVSGREQRLIKRRPDPPLGLRLLNGSLTWESPREIENVSHFNIYVGGELPTNLAASVPAVQRRLDGVEETSVFISSYDDRLRLESRRVKVVGSAITGIVTNDARVLSAASTNLSAITTAADGLLYFMTIEIDSTPGRQIVWGSEFIGVTADDIDNNANAKNYYAFFGSTALAKWCCFAKMLGV